MDADRPILRALLWCSATALQYLTRTKAIACVPRLVAKHHSNAEPINIALTEYLTRCEYIHVSSIAASMPQTDMRSHVPFRVQS